MTGFVDIGKKDLCEKLGWSRPTLDKRLKEDPNFPVKKRGGRGGGWLFDEADVRSYLNGSDTEIAADADQEHREAYIQAPRRVTHGGEATATQRYKESQAALNEDRLLRQRGELVEASDVRQALSTMLAELKSSLTDLPGLLGKEFDWSEREIQSVRLKVEASMRQMSKRIREQLTDA